MSREDAMDRLAERVAENCIRAMREHNWQREMRGCVPDLRWIKIYGFQSEELTPEEQEHVSGCEDCLRRQKRDANRDWSRFRS